MFGYFFNVMHGRVKGLIVAFTYPNLIFLLRKRNFKIQFLLLAAFSPNIPLLCDPSGKYHNLDKYYTCDSDRKKVSIIWTYTFFTFEQPVKIENYLSYYIQKGVFKIFLKFTGIYLRLYIEYTCFSILSQSVGT